jgi:opacity protein-like surface antigen
MKPILLLTIVFTLTLAPRVARADGPTLELKSGTMLAGGTIGYSRTDNSSEGSGITFDQINSELVFSPTIGYFITPTIALTGAVQVGLKTQDGEIRSQLSRTQMIDEEKPKGFALGMRFLIPTGGRMCFYAGGEVAYTWTDTETRQEAWDAGVLEYSVDSRAEGNLMGINVVGGLLYSLTTHVALDLGLKFSYQKGTSETEGQPGTTDLENNGFAFGYLGLMAFF